MCCFVRCYFANTKIDESFRTAKIRRTFFGNSLASKFAGCVRKYDSGTGRLRAAPEKLRFESRRKQKSRPSGAQIVFFTIFGVVTTLLSVGRFCKAICNSVLEQAHFFPIFVVQSATAGCLDCTRNLVNFRKQSSAYPACGAACAVWHGIWFPTSLRRGLYVLIAFKVYQNPVWNK